MNSDAAVNSMPIQGCSQSGNGADVVVVDTGVDVVPAVVVVAKVVVVSATDTRRSGGPIN